MSERIRLVQGSVSHSTLVEAGMWVEVAKEFKYWDGSAVQTGYRSLGQTQVLGDGSFSLPMVEDSRVAAGLGGRLSQNVPIKHYVVYQADDLTVPQFAWDTEDQPYELDLTASGTPVNTSNAWVTGVVRSEDGFALAGLKVQLIALSAGAETKLTVSGGSATEVATDAEGRFAFNHDHAGKDVVVRVLDGSVTTYLASSDVLDDAKSYERVYIEVGGEAYAGPSEFAEVAGELYDPLGTGDPPSGPPNTTTLAGITAQGLGLLARRTRLEPMVVSRYVAAWRMERRLFDEAGVTVDREWIYGLLCDGHPPVLTTLVNLEQDRIQKSLERSEERAKVGSGWSASSIRAAFDTFLKVGLAPASAGGLSTQLQTDVITDLLILNAGDSLSLADSEIEDFVTRYLASTGTATAFWDDWKTSNSLTADQVEETQRRIVMAQVLLRHVGLIEDLCASGHASAGTIDFPRGLTRLTHSDWQTLIASCAHITATTHFPEGIQGTDVSTMTDSYAAVILDNSERMFPSAAFAAGAEQAGAVGGATDLQKSVRNFVQKNVFHDGETAPFPEPFDIETSDVDGYFTSDLISFTLVGSTTNDDVKGWLRVRQRLFRLVPDTDRYTNVEALVAAGIESAWPLVNRGQRAFISASYGSLDASGSRETFARAEHVVATSLAVFAEHSPAMQGPPIPSMPHLAREIAGTSPPALNVPGYTDIFGGSSYCATTHAESVLGPAAYMMDLLNFADGLTPATGFTTALDALKYVTSTAAGDRRRSDIVDVELSKDNTDIVVPYIDLVNEVLEAQVSGSTSMPTATTGSSALRRAEPEHRDDDAYTSATSTPGVANAYFPFSLPFDRAAEESRAFLRHLGAGGDFRWTFRRAADDPSGADLTDDLLGLHPHQWDAANAYSLDTWWGTSTTLSTHERWGMPATGWLAELAAVPALLAHSGCSLVELYDAVHTRLVQPSPTTVPIDVTFTDACDIETGTLQENGGTPTDDTYRRLLCVLRLAKDTGLSILDLDRLAKAWDGLEGTPATAGAYLKDPFKADLGVLARLQTATGLEVNEVLTWFADIDTFNGRAVRMPVDACHYDQLFQHAGLSADAATAFALNGARTELAVTTYTIGSVSTGTHGDQPEVTNVLLEALGVGLSDVASLVSHPAALDANGVGSDSMTLSNLSMLLRWTSLARAVGMSVPDLLAAYDVLSSGTTPAITAPFDAASKSAMLDWVEELRVLRDGLMDTDIYRFICRHDSTAAARLGITDPDMLARLWGLREELLKVVPADGDRGVIDTSSGYDEDEIRRETVVAYVAGTLGLVGSLAAVLLAQLKYGGSDSVLDPLTKDSAGALRNAALDELDSDTFFTTVAASTYDSLRESWIRIEKSALLCLRLGWDAGMVAALYDTTSGSTGASHYDLPDFNDIPTTSAATALSSVVLSNARKITALGAGIRVDGASLSDLLIVGADTASDIAFLSSFASAFDWSGPELSSLKADHLRQTGGGAFTASDWSVLDNWFRVHRMMEFARGVGVAPTRLATIARSSYDTAAASEVRAIARSRYDQPTWLKTVQPIQDKLRVAQRDALLASVMFAHGLQSRGEVYQRLLLDPDMSPCQLTSRLKMALSTVQLFLHRAMLGQESATAGFAQQQQWEWMKQYRVWEAARKVYLWPENWIAPDLRRHKTEFFSKLEDALLQGELGDEAIDQAYIGYLRDLHEVSNLRILSFFHDTQSDDDGDLDRLYVFARTNTFPSTYYWRVRHDGARWEPWKKLELKVEGDHLIPVVHEGRLLLIWPMFEQVSETRTTHGGREFQVTYNAARLVWSELRESGWSAPVVTPDALPMLVRNRNQNMVIPPEDIVFRAAAPSASLLAAAGRTVDGLLVSAWVRQEEDDDGDGETTSAFYPLGLLLLNDCTGHFERKYESDIWGEPGKVYSYGDNLETDEPTGVPAGTEPDGMASLGDEEVRLPIDRLGDPLDQPVVLSDVPSEFRVVGPHSEWDFDADETICFFGDGKRTYLVRRKPAVRRKDAKPTSFGAGAAFDTPKFLDGAFSLSKPQATKVVAPVQMEAFRPTRNVEGGGDTGLATRGAKRRGRRRKAGLGALRAASRTAPLSANFDSSAGRRRAASAMVLDTRAKNVMQRAATFFNASSGDGDPGILGKRMRTRRQFEFLPLHHPYVCNFMVQVRRHGVDGLLRPDPEGLNGGLVQQQLEDTSSFSADYSPTKWVAGPYPAESIDFGAGSPNGLYNWEVFFHGPLYIADVLRRDQKFKEALRWLQAVFDPTGVDADSLSTDAWRIKPFAADVTDSLDRLEQLASNTYDDSTSEVLERLTAEIRQWREDPFDPHGLAELRVSAYQKFVFMRYLDILVEWADHLFRQDSMESLNEATNLYVTAAELLGPRPIAVDRNSAPTTFSYDDVVTGSTGAPSNKLTDLERVLGRSPGTGATRGVQRAIQGMESLFYFQIPANERLLGYWDVLEDRFYKVRNCMNIDGVGRQLPLFQPPVDPALLVRAAAAGVDLSTAVSSFNLKRPHYRYSVLSQRAQQYAGTVRSLGGSLLQALEKRDAEHLSVLRAGHETAVQDMVTAVREGDVEEARLALEGLRRQRQVTVSRRTHYERLLDKGLLKSEKLQSGLLWSSLSVAAAAGTTSAIAHAVGLLTPEVSAGSSGAKPLWTVKVADGKKTIDAGKLILDLGLTSATVLSATGSIAGIRASRQRREQDWDFQVRSAERELDTIAVQIEAAEERLENAQRNLRIHNRQAQNAAEVQDYLRSKFTNKALYNWMAGQLSSLYYQSYQLAFEMARKAEAAWQYELGDQSQSFIQYGYWNSGKKGLLAGERLQLDLERMDAAYLDNNKREEELVKTFSLASHDPSALVHLIEEGNAYFSMPEVLFDLDFPGQYYRRIRSVSVTVTAVAGSTAGVHARLKLHNSWVRSEAGRSGGSLDLETATSETRTFAVSVDDTGLHRGTEDGRFGPFEGRGAVAQWEVQLTDALSQFDRRSISDVVLSIRYTARDAEAEAAGVIAGIEASLNSMESNADNAGLADFDGSLLGLSMRRDFPDEWFRFLNETGVSATHELSLGLDSSMLPVAHRDATTTLVKAHVLLVLENGTTIGSGLVGALEIDPTSETATFNNTDFGGASVGATVAGTLAGKAGSALWTDWTLSFTEPQLDAVTGTPGYITGTSGSKRLDPTKVVDAVVLINYTLS